MMDIDVFACLPVGDLPRAVTWYDRFLGDVESFEPNDTERVWTLAEHRHVYVELLPEHAGHAKVTLFVSDFDGFLAAVGGPRPHPGRRGGLRQRRAQGAVPGPGRQRDRDRRDAGGLTGPGRVPRMCRPAGIGYAVVPVAGECEEADRQPSPAGRTPSRPAGLAPVRLYRPRSSRVAPSSTVMPSGSWSGSPSTTTP